MDLKKELPKEKPLRDDECTRVLLTATGNGLIMKIDDPFSEIATVAVYELEDDSISDLNRIDPEKLQKFLYDLMDVLYINPSNSAKKELNIVVEDRKDKE